MCTRICCFIPSLQFIVWVVSFVVPRPSTRLIAWSCSHHWPVLVICDGRESLHLDRLIRVSEVCIPSIVQRAQLWKATGCRDKDITWSAIFHCKHHCEVMKSVISFRTKLWKRPWFYILVTPAEMLQVPKQTNVKFKYNDTTNDFYYLLIYGNINPCNTVYEKSQCKQTISYRILSMLSIFNEWWTNNNKHLWDNEEHVVKT